MAINPNILLQAESPRFGEIISNAIQQRKQNELMQSQENRANQLLGLRQEAQEREIAKQEDDKVRRDFSNQYLAEFKPLLQSGDVAGLQNAITRSIEENRDNAGMSESLEEFNQIIQRDPLSAEDSGDKIVEQARFDKLIRDPNANKTKRGDFFTTKEVFLDDSQEPTIVQINSRDTGSVFTLDGQQIDATRIRSVKQDIKHQSSLAGGKKGAQESAKITSKAAKDLPEIRTSAKQMVETVDRILNHKAFSSVVGAPSAGKVLQFVAGTPEADFRLLQKTLEGQAFIQQYQKIKGAGPITDIEGIKATDAALARMKTASSEKAYRTAARDFKVSLARLVRNAEKKANVKRKTPTTKPKNTKEDFSGFKLLGVE